MRILDAYKSGKKVFHELPDNFPDELLSEDWANKIHSQTLQRLNERGGLTVTELLMNLNRMDMGSYISKYGYNHEATQEHVNQLMSHLKKHEVDIRK